MPNMTVKTLGNIRLSGNFKTVQEQINRLMIAEIAADPSPHMFQDVDASAPFYVKGLSLSRLK
jgi:hypothetical protein